MNWGSVYPNMEAKLADQSFFVSIAPIEDPSRYKFRYIVAATVGSLAIKSIESSYTYCNDRIMILIFHSK